MKTLTALFLLCASALYIGCGNDAPSCAEAMDRFHDNGCTFVNGNNDEIPRQESIQSCEATHSSMKEAKSLCVRQMEAFLECLGSTPASGDDRCGRCQDHLTAMVNCK